MNEALQIPRILADAGEDYGKLQLALDKLQRVQWIQGMGPWDVMMTGTFRWSASMDSAKRCFRRWISRKLGRVSFYYAIERNPSRSGYHVHSLWAGARTVFRKEMWADWFGRYGRCRIEPVRSVKDSSDYCSKYLCKSDCWWDWFLQWDRIRRVNGETDFSLVRTTASALASSFAGADEVGLVQVEDQSRLVGDLVELAGRRPPAQVGIRWIQTGPGIWEPSESTRPVGI